MPYRYGNLNTTDGMIITYNITICFKLIDVHRGIITYRKALLATIHTKILCLIIYYSRLINLLYTGLKRIFKSFWEKNQKENKVYRKTISCPIWSSSKVFGGSLKFR